MTQRDRDRLVALKKAKKGLITQREGAAEIGQSERHIRRLLLKLRADGDAAVIHQLRGRPSNRKLDDKVKSTAIRILSRKVYAGFGPTLAAEYLADRHQIQAGRETVRKWMIEGKLWRAKKQRIDKVHQVANDYTIQFDNKIYQIARTDVRAGLRGSQVRVEVRLDDSLAVRFRNHYLTIAECHGRSPSEAPVKVVRKPSAPRPKSQWMKNFRFTSQEKTALSVIPSASPASPARGNR